MTTEHRIDIFLSTNEDSGICGWMSRDNDPQIMDLFATDTLPTPFLESTPADDVLATLRELNPTATISVIEDPSND